MNIDQLEKNLNLLVRSIDRDTFIYKLLEAYNLPKASISRLQKGVLNLSKIQGEVSWKKKLFFKEELNNDLHLTISQLREELKHNQRFVIVTDYKTILAIDSLTNDRLDISITDLPKHYDFFLPWAGMEKAKHAAENPADVKAAEKMARLFDEIKKDNPDTTVESLRNLNSFFSRLLFCYFAEDTNIFDDNQFSHAIQSHTESNGSDLSTYLNRLFWVLNTPVDKRGDIPHYLNAFPYVNGGLFKEEIPSPKFTTKSRQLLIESGDSNDWSAINPDIFGSMFQAVISPEHRGGLGAHYTSVPNIMKVIEPLFLDELKEAFEDAVGNEKKLKELLYRISKIKLFDPACGSGNFLIIAYKELRRLEMRILKELGGLALSGIHLNNFYGIELDDFAHEIAKLSLWLAEHQMNVEFLNEFGRTNPTLPLQEAGQIVCGNACRLDWEKVCPKMEWDEIYIMGNPPYIGFLQQNSEQKKDMDFVFKGLSNMKKLDYISCWFFKGAKYVESFGAKLSFVSTNSIVQGEQVSLLWPTLLEKLKNEIFFAHQSFLWLNNAKGNAGITCVIIGLRKVSFEKKYIFNHKIKSEVSNINAYLSPTKNLYIEKRGKAFSDLPTISLGSSAYDGGFLMVSEEERNEQIKKDLRFEKYIKKFVGSLEFVRGINRFCIWIKDSELNEALEIEFIRDRLNSVKEFRLKSERGKTYEFANIPNRFVEDRHLDSPSLIIPIVTSERREYLTLGFLSNQELIPNSARTIYNAEPYLFSILSSKSHMIWVKAVGGRLRTDIRYSAGVCYNSFPFPQISKLHKQELTQCAFRILEEREKHPEKTLAQLYDPDKMPEGLKEAHRLNDEAVERCYRSTPFNSDEERLEYLFKLYEKMIQEENTRGTLFEIEKKSRKKK
jgi:type I restriction-modification system DNA methylase subunit